tara:strand:- start:596 stop:964 length:369 start_codon:yes stop_codon:yes gene_type:complete
MEIDKKIIKKLIDALEDLKQSLGKAGEKLDILDVEKVSQIDDNKNYNAIKSPIIGTAYLAPEPGAKPFVEIGKKIKKGDTIMIVEAMKTMNHIPSTVNGTINKIAVKDGQPVEYGQILVVLD